MGVDGRVFRWHKPFMNGGSNAYPYNFDALQELFEIDPTEDYEEEGDD